jgi:hypothetical protein
VPQAADAPFRAVMEKLRIGCGPDSHHPSGLSDRRERPFRLRAFTGSRPAKCKGGFRRCEDASPGRSRSSAPRERSPVPPSHMRRPAAQPRPAQAHRRAARARAQATARHRRAARAPAPEQPVPPEPPAGISAPTWRAAMAPAWARRARAADRVSRPPARAGGRVARHAARRATLARSRRPIYTARSRGCSSVG